MKVAILLLALAGKGREHQLLGASVQRTEFLWHLLCMPGRAPYQFYGAILINFYKF